MRRFLVLLFASSLFFWACSGTDTSSGTSQPVVQDPTAEVVVQSELARAIPASVTSLRFTATDAAGNRVFGPDTRPKARLIRLIIPITAVSLQIEYLQGDTVVGLYTQALSLTAGTSLVINDPAFVDVSTIESITLAPSNPSLQTGDTQAFTATANLSNTTSSPLGAGVVWSSSDQAVATIDANGLATAVGPGTTTIAATFQGVTGSTVLTVTSPAVAPVATSLVFTGQPVDSQATVVMAPVTLEVRDQNNALFTANPVAVTLTLVGGPTLGGTLTVNTVNGVADFTDLTLSAAGTGLTLQASAPGLPTATSAAFDARPAPGTAVTFMLPNANSGPAGIITGPDGNLWFTESLGGRIGRITPTGTISEFTSGLSGLIQLLAITSSPSDNSLYFTERNPGASGRVGVMTTAGVGTEFVTLGNNSLPGGIDLGPDGNIWWTLSSNQAPNDGSAIGTNDTPPTATQFFSAGISANPTLVDIVAGPDGNLWFTESSLAQLGRMDTSGVVINELPTGLNPTTLCVGPDGQIWYVRDGGAGLVDAVERMDTTGTVTGTFLLPVDSNPVDLCAGPDGNVWVTLTSVSGEAALARVTPAGVVTVFPEPTLTGPIGICAGPDGNLWVCASLGNLIARVTP